MEEMLDDAVEVLTKFKIEQSIRDNKKGSKTMIVISKTDLIGICIDLCKIMQKYEVEYANHN